MKTTNGLYLLVEEKIDEETTLVIEIQPGKDGELFTLVMGANGNLCRIEGMGEEGLGKMQKIFSTLNHALVKFETYKDFEKDRI